MFSTDAAGPSSVLPRADVSTHAPTTLRATPNVHGTSGISDQLGVLGVTVDKLRPFMEVDISKTRQCPIDNVLQVFLQYASRQPEVEKHGLLDRCLKQVVPLLNKPLATGVYHPRRIREYLNKYASSQLESASYAHFIKAFNVALKCLEGLRVEGMRDAPSNLHVICQAGDYPMQQGHMGHISTRKPDVLILPYKCAHDILPEDKRNISPSTYKLINAAEKPKAQIPWECVLACIEFKRPNRKLLQCPGSYKVAQYKPTNPEYRPVEHLVPDVPPYAAPVPAPATTAPPAPPPDHSQNVSKKSGKRKADETLKVSTKYTKIEKKEKEEPEGKLDVAVQTGLYAAEMFAANVAVKHVINLIVVGDVVWVWYYDRQGIIHSSGINFIQDLPRFMVLLYAVQRFSLSDWGRHEDFEKDEKSNSHKIRIDNVDLELHSKHEDRVTHYGLMGRATNVFPVTSKKLAEDKPDVTKAGMVAKLFWGEEQRASEPEILQEVRRIAERQGSVKDHVPTLLLHYTFTGSTSKIREALGVLDSKIGSRVLYILVFPKLQPITDLEGADFFNVWKQCIICHRALWQAGVYHRDIIPRNLMWYYKDNEIIGVLSNYNISSLAAAQGPQGNERTGEISFMALDLLTQKGQRGEVQHLYRHDLESFMWVLVWVALRYKDGKLLPRENRPLDKWATVDVEACWEKKSSFLTAVNDYAPFARNHRIWDLIIDCFEVLDAESRRRRRLSYEQRRLREEGGGQVAAEEIELEDREFVDLFMNTKAWVWFSRSLK